MELESPLVLKLFEFASQADQHGLSSSICLKLCAYEEKVHNFLVAIKQFYKGCDRWSVRPSVTSYQLREKSLSQRANINIYMICLLLTS